MNLIHEVRKRQFKEGLSDAKFGPKLGISRHMWGAVLKGKRQAGYKVLSGIARAYPDLTDEVLDVVDAKVLRQGGQSIK